MPRPAPPAPRAFVAGFAQETNVFGPLPTGLGAFGGRFELGGRRHDDPPPYPEALVASGRTRAAAGHVTLIEGPQIGAHPSGLVTRVAYETLRDTILRSLSEALPVEVVALHLHGAMAADGYDDCEGDLLARIRGLVGPKVVLGAMLDPHALLSTEMVAEANVLVAYKEYPHTDFRERAEEVWDLLLATQAGRIHPVSAVWDTRAIAVFHTSRPDVRELVDWMQAREASGEALSVSLIHGFPWGDGPSFGTRALVICDGDARKADRLAAELAARARALAETIPAGGLRLEAALALLESDPSLARRPLVLADSADNPGGGAAGDSTYVLAHLLEHKVERTCLGPVWDPQAVAIAFDAGVGARLPLRVGGKTGPLSGAPIDLDAEVLALAKTGAQLFAGEPFALGRVAAIRAGGVEVVLVSERDQARGPDLFTNHGIMLADKRLIVVKSSQHFHAGFAPLAGRVEYLDGPGSLQSSLELYPYRDVVRPRWPLDAQAPPPERAGPPLA